LIIEFYLQNVKLKIVCTFKNNRKNKNKIHGKML
jgi:hypothetical protein